MDSTLDVDGTGVPVTNLEKVFYPKSGFTKGEVIDYYVRISPVLLPHLEGRPISLKRYPDGVEGHFFYEKQCPSHAPKWIRTRRVAKSDGKIDYCVLDDLRSLVWAANLANLEFHSFQHRGRTLTRPTALVLDLDPGPPADIRQCCEVALILNDVLGNLDLRSYPKTSGSKGLQIVVPLNTSVTYSRTKAFAHALAKLLEDRHPKLVVSRMQRSLRGGKVFIDWSQNDAKKTTVTAYSLRARDEPTVSTPVTWDEVFNSLKRKTPLRFTATQVLKRVEKQGDLLQPVLALKQTLPTAKAVD